MKSTTLKILGSLILSASLILPNPSMQLKPMAAEYSSVTAIWETPGNGTVHTAKTNSDILNLIKTMQPGDTIEIEDGEYTFFNPIIINSSLRGKISAPKIMRAKNPGRVSFDFSSLSTSGSNRGIVLDSDFWHIYGIEIKNAGDNGMLLSGNYNVLERCVFSGNKDSGLQVSRYNSYKDSVDLWPAYNLIKNCSSHDNCDSDGENADGFAAKLTCGYGNVFDGCLAYNNSDDGWDLFEKPDTGTIGIVTIKNCIAFRNGLLSDGTGTSQGDMNGFKLGSSYANTCHRVINCIAFENGATGFTDNGNHDAIELSYCTAFNNKKANFSMGREIGGKNSNLLSVITSEVNNSDAFVGTLSNSLYFNKNMYASSRKLNFINGTKAFSGAGSSFDSQYSTTANDFESLSLPAAGTVNFDSYLRDENGNIDLKGFLKIKSSSPLSSLAEDGGALGARIGAADAHDITTLPSDLPDEDDDDDKEYETYSLNITDCLERAGVTKELTSFLPMNGPDIFGIFTLTNWKIPSKATNMISLRGDISPLGMLRIDAPNAGTLRIRTRSSGANDIADIVMLTQEQNTINEQSNTTRIVGSTPAVLTYKLPQKGVYYLTYPQNASNLKDIRILSAEFECEVGSSGDLPSAAPSNTPISTTAATPTHTAFSTTAAAPTLAATSTAAAEPTSTKPAPSADPDAFSDITATAAPAATFNAVSQNIPTGAVSQNRTTAAPTATFNAVSQNIPTAAVSQNRPTDAVSQNRPTAAPAATFNAVSQNRPTDAVSQNRPTDAVSQNRPTAAPAATFNAVSQNRPTDAVSQNTAAAAASSNQVIGSKEKPQCIVIKGKLDIRSSLTVSANVSGKIKYLSADKSILTVNSKGIVKAKKSGSTYVAAYVKENGSYRKVSNSYFVKVEVPIVKKKVTATAGKPFKVSELVTESSTTLSVNDIAVAKPSVASLNNGIITPLTKGSTKLTFTIGTVKYKVSVKVN